VPYQVYKTVDFDQTKSGLTTVGYRLKIPGATRQTTGVEELLAGSGTYGAWITVPDDINGDPIRGCGLLWDTGETNPEFAADEINLALLDLAQPIIDDQSTTVGGALASSWAVGWGRVLKNLVAKTLGIFGPGNVSATPSRTFHLDQVVNPSERTPV
jgi:hypothetical protein